LQVQMKFDTHIDRQQAASSLRRCDESRDVEVALATLLPGAAFIRRPRHSSSAGELWGPRGLPVLRHVGGGFASGEEHGEALSVRQDPIAPSPVVVVLWSDLAGTPAQRPTCGGSGLSPPPTAVAAMMAAASAWWWLRAQQHCGGGGGVDSRGLW
jgi:hypothetical protein